MLIGITPNCLAKWAREGSVATIKVGRLNRYPAKEIRRIIRAEKPRAQADKLLGTMELLVKSNNEEIKKEAASGRKLRKPKSPD